MARRPDVTADMEQVFVDHGAVMIGDRFVEVEDYQPRLTAAQRRQKIAELTQAFLKFDTVAEYGVMEFVGPDGTLVSRFEDLHEAMAEDRNRGAADEPLTHILPSLTQAISRDQDPRQELNIKTKRYMPSLWDKAEARLAVSGLKPKARFALEL